MSLLPMPSDCAASAIGLDPTVSGGALAIDNPNVGWTDPLALRVRAVLDTQVNPGVAAHGGSIDLLEVRDGTAYISMGGGCVGCAQVDVTLRQGLPGAPARHRQPRRGRLEGYA